MRKIFIGFMTPLFLLASGDGDTVALLPMLAGFIVVIVLFFWGIYKAIKTQKTVYALAMLPFILLLVGMFFI